MVFNNASFVIGMAITLGFFNFHFNGMGIVKFPSRMFIVWWVLVKVNGKIVVTVSIMYVDEVEVMSVTTVFCGFVYVIVNVIFPTSLK